jgi:hypothetical protein
MAEKINDVDHVDYNSHDSNDEKHEAQETGRRESVALNIVENPLRVSTWTYWNVPLAKYGQTPNIFYSARYTRADCG